MGAWDIDNFANDAAGDWCYDLESSTGTSFLLQAIYEVKNSNTYLEMEVCSYALAASEVINASLTGDTTRIPEEVNEWLNTKQGFIFKKLPKITKNHASEAILSVKKIIKGSELQELWEESDNYKDWIGVQEALLESLQRID